MNDINDNGAPTHSASMHASSGGDAPGRLAPVAATIQQRLEGRSIVLVGMMGAGKTSIGRRLSSTLSLPFVDADVEIEKAAGISIAEIFARHGEAYFRDGERRVIARLLTEHQGIIATGGGAWMNPATRERIARHGISIWLKADIEVLLQRVRKRTNRPLLSQNPEETLRTLIDERYPVYALADFTVASRDGPHQIMIEQILETLDAGLEGRTPSPAAAGAAQSPRPEPNAQSAPAGAAPIIVPVALGERAYEIHIGEGLILIWIRFDLQRDVAIVK